MTVHGNGLHAFGEQPLPPWRRAVLKVGSSLLAADDGGLTDRFAADLARFVADCRAQGREVVIVSSGAVAAGRGLLHTDAAGLTQRQALAALGQAPMIALWQRLSDVPVAQVLLSHDDVRNRRRYLNARATLRELLRLGALPVVNENDTVAVDELKLGDNDNLAAVVAALVDAEVLLIATDIAGLYSGHPLRDPHARPVPRVDAITAETHRMAAGDAGAIGTGGMRTKLEAASKAAAAGIGTALFCGRDADTVAALSRGTLHGTWIAAHGDRLLARKLWMRHAPAGLHGVEVDAGAAQALGVRGASLLPGGVVEVKGEFGRGDLVEVRLAGDATARVLARGLVQYNATDLRRIVGRHSRDIESILGYRYAESVIHRDDLVVLPQEDAA
ncbi:glutamate 5-kinase [Montanilutibacter psychrotolerans]|uniref:Glutamate 5-kinase n=1 Tax=Montanilutibacter psychrotolerans TaxID=1327343 RepID=A0A3M8SYD3_9GAMM|nr:glutamate 5-kinase [Lysobacter psychrotolerans]RNF86428.1 glutamate 5-kinase [Lysobacter psychrotolerans]